MSEFSKKRRWGPDPRYPLVETYQRPNNNFVIIAGPCSMESTNQLSVITETVKKYATHLRSGVFRAGTYKGNKFGWIEKNQIKEFHQIAKNNGLKNIIEILDYRDLDWVSELADCFQVGARQTQNYTLLNEVGKTAKPIFLKRNVGITIDEFLGAANYILEAGCKELYLIERGSSTYHCDVRWTPTIHMIPSVQSICDIPIIWDASHGCGRRDLVSKICIAGVGAGADGVLIETHYDPQSSISDAEQTISLLEFESLMNKIIKVRAVINEK